MSKTNWETDILNHAQTGKLMQIAKPFSIIVLKGNYLRRAQIKEGKRYGCRVTINVHYACSLNRT